MKAKTLFLSCEHSIVAFSRRSRVAAGVLAAALWSGAASAASFTGHLATDASVQLFTFDVSTPTVVTLKGYGFAGGTMADGTVVGGGGFDSILAVFDSAGKKIAQNDDGEPGQVGTDKVLGKHYDSYLSLKLEAGSYTVALTQADNFAGDTLESEFIHSVPYFTAVFGCSNARFCDQYGHNLSDAWALDVTGADHVAVTPVPAALPLLGSGMVGLGMLAHRRRRRG